MLLRKTTIAVLVMLLCLSPSILPAKSVYKIGGIFSSTGRASFLGDPEKKTMEMMVEPVALMVTCSKR